MLKLLFVGTLASLISLASTARETGSSNYASNAANEYYVGGTKTKKTVSKKKKATAKKTTAKKSKAKSKTVSKKAKVSTKKVVAKKKIERFPQDEFGRNKGNFGWPMEEMVVKTGFGLYKVGDNGIMGNNPGLTLEAAQGADVKSIFDGVVIDLFRIDDNWGVIIQHGSYFTVYGNLASVNVAENDKIDINSVIGKAASNKDGNSEIEFLLLVNDKNIDPSPWIKKL